MAEPADQPQAPTEAEPETAAAADTGVADADEAELATDVSLYEVQLARNAVLGRDVLLARVVFVAYFPEMSTEEMRAVLAEYFASAGGHFTGAMFYAETSTLHALEAPALSLRALLRRPPPALDGLRVVAYIDNIPARSFPSWVACKVTASKKATELIEPETLQVMITEFRTNMLRLGHAMEPSSSADEMTATIRQNAELLPSPIFVTSCLQTESCSWAREEYAQTFLAAHSFSLASETVWPAASGTVVAGL